MSTEHLNIVEHAGTGPPALLVHGALGSRSYWAANVAALGEVCRPIVVELWGHGRSPSPTDSGRYLVQAYIEEFEHIRHTLGIDRWVTIGQSMGASLTLQYGLAHPGRVICQIITNSSSAFSDPDGWVERNRELVRPLAAEVDRVGVGALVDSFVNPGRSRRIPERVRDLLAQEFAEHTASGISSSLRYTNADLPLGERVVDVSVPTLLTLGVAEERFVKLLDRVRRIPGLEIVELPAAHAVNAQDPDGWNAAAVAYLSARLAGDGTLEP